MKKLLGDFDHLIAIEKLDLTRLTGVQDRSSAQAASEPAVCYSVAVLRNVTVDMLRTSKTIRRLFFD